MQPTSIEIIQILKKAGHEAYWAGGCVRDMLLRIVPKDYDIVTSAKPDEIEALLEKTIPVGKEFGVILAVRNGHNFEVATFRSDSGTSDGRRPDAVEFTNGEEDAKRRDFTINALFYDPTTDKIFDFVGGQKDLDARLVRFIGDPHERIMEDHLRIMRAIRFKNVLKFQYHPETYEALEAHASLAANVSQERLRDELNKIMAADPPSIVTAFEDMSATGVLKDVLPEFEDMKGVAQPYEFHQEGDVWEHTMRSLLALKPESPQSVRWAVALHDIGKPETFKLSERIRFDGHAEKSAQMAQTILSRLKFPNKDIKHIVWLTEHHMSVYNVLEMNPGRRRHWFLHPWFLELLELNRCDASGAVPAHLDLYEQTLKLYREDLKEMPEEPKRLLTGEDIMELCNIEAGERVGEILEMLREKQLAKEIQTREEAEAWARKLS